MNKEIDKVRAEEARELKAQGNELLKHTKWLILKRPENRTEKEEVKLRELLRYNLHIPRDGGHLFHGMAATYSTGWRPPIPRDGGHPFHGMTATHSTGWRPPIPRDHGHPFHGMTATYSTGSRPVG